jgi:hypothetical protein
MVSENGASRVRAQLLVRPGIDTGPSRIVVCWGAAAARSAAPGNDMLSRPPANKETT